MTEYLHQERAGKVATNAGGQSKTFDETRDMLVGEAIGGNPGIRFEYASKHRPMRDPSQPQPEV